MVASVKKPAFQVKQRVVCRAFTPWARSPVLVPSQLPKCRRCINSARGAREGKRAREPNNCLGRAWVASASKNYDHNFSIYGDFHFK